MRKLKIVVLFLIIFLLAGCSTIKEQTYDDIIAETVTSSKVTNTYRKGYKYYLPNGLKIINSHDFNEIITGSNYTMYLYVDVVSYYNNIKFDYKIANNAYYSYKLDNGYIEINKVNKDKYLIEIMDNYAKIEVIVDEYDIKSALTYSSIVLSSIEYKYDVLDNLMQDNLLNSNEVEFDIFKTVSNSTDFAIYEAEYGQYDETLKDTDLID